MSTYNDEYMIIFYLKHIKLVFSFYYNIQLKTAQLLYISFSFCASLVPVSFVLYTL